MNTTEFNKLVADYTEACEEVAGIQSRIDQLEDDLWDAQELRDDLKAKLDESGVEVGIVTTSGLASIHAEEKSKYEKLTGKPYTGRCEAHGIKVIGVK